MSRSANKRREGYAAFDPWNDPMFWCPYGFDTFNARNWMDGWLEAKADYERNPPKPEPEPEPEPTSALDIALAAIARHFADSDDLTNVSLYDSEENFVTSIDVSSFLK